MDQKGKEQMQKQERDVRIEEGEKGLQGSSDM